MNTPTPLRVVFFGTPDFSVPTLDTIVHDKRFSVIACVTQPDKPVGRKKILTPPPVKTYALEHSIPVLQPESLKIKRESGQLFLNAFTDLQPDIAVLIAYGNIIPQAILDIPRLGFVNLHLSLLPRLRGASPVQTAIAQGDTETGVTLMKMDAGMDTGPIIAAEHIPIEPRETTETLNKNIGQLSATVAKKYVYEYCTGALPPQDQDESKATTSHIIQKTDGEIDWTQPPEAIERRIRAFTPWPGTYTFCNGKRVKILSAHLELDGSLAIDTVQPEGKQPMSYSDFLRGNPNCTFGATN